MNDEEMRGLLRQNVKSAAIHLLEYTKAAAFQLELGDGRVCGGVAGGLFEVARAGLVADRFGTEGWLVVHGIRKSWPTYRAAATVSLAQRSVE